jgi:hypothetical protein
MFYHHNTIRTYTGALLNLFNDLEVQYKNSLGEVTSRNIPIRFASKEKSKILDEYTTEQLTSGNYNVLPRANLAWSNMIRAEQRTTNKHIKINTKANENTFEFLYNSVPYEFTYELTIMCRGMSEATMIIEQIACKFNPIINIDVFDATNLDEPTRIPVTLLDIGLEPSEYEELSSNIINVNVGLSIKGNIYPPIKSIERIKEFKMFLNESLEDNFNNYKKKTVFSYDVIDGELENGNIFIPEIMDTYPRIIEIVGSNIGLGSNNILTIWEDDDSTIRELTFEWFILSGSASITGDIDEAILNISDVGSVEVLCKITDENGNYNSKSKIFTVL